jgi:uncharacterized membrane protein
MELALAIAIFALSHIAIARTAIKPLLIRIIGERGYLIGYSVLSIILLVWVIAALLRTERIFLWSTPDWAHHFAFAATAIAYALLGAGAASPNPYSVSFRKDGFDGQRPGLIGWVRHPIIWAFGLWGLAHIPANGDLAALALFGGTALFSIVGAFAVERRLRKQHGSSRLSLGRGSFDRRAVIGAATGLIAWLAFLVAHPILFGVDPLAAIFPPC